MLHFFFYLYLLFHDKFQLLIKFLINFYLMFGNLGLSPFLKRFIIFFGLLLYYFHLGYKVDSIVSRNMRFGRAIWLCSTRTWVMRSHNWRVDRRCEYVDVKYVTCSWALMIILAKFWKQLNSFSFLTIRFTKISSMKKALSSHCIIHNFCFQC